MSRFDYDTIFYRVFCATILGIAFTFTVILTNVFIDIDGLLSKKDDNSHTTPNILKDKYKPIEINKNEIEYYNEEQNYMDDSDSYRAKRSIEPNDFVFQVKNPNMKKILTNKLATLLEEMDQEETAKGAVKPDEKETRRKEELDEAGNDNMLHLAMHNILLQGIIGHMDLNDVYKKVHLLIRNFYDSKNSENPQKHDKAVNSKELGMKQASNTEEQKFFEELLKCKSLQNQLAEETKNESQKPNLKHKEPKLFIKTVIEINENRKFNKENDSQNKDIIGLIKLIYNGKSIKFQKMDDEETLPVNHKSPNEKYKNSRKHSEFQIHNEDIAESTTVQTMDDNFMSNPAFHKIIESYLKQYPMANPSQKDVDKKATANRLKRQIKIHYVDKATTHKPKPAHDKLKKDDEELYIEIETHFDGKGSKGEKKKKMVRNLIDKIQKAINEDSTHEKKASFKHIKVKKRNQDPIKPKLDNFFSKIAPSLLNIDRREVDPIGKILPHVDDILDYRGDNWKRKNFGPAFLTSSKSVNSAEMGELVIHYDSMLNDDIPKRVQKPITIEQDNLKTDNTNNVTFYLKDIDGSGFSVGFNQYVDEPPDADSLKLFNGLENLIKEYHKSYDTEDVNNMDKVENADLNRKAAIKDTEIPDTMADEEVQNSDLLPLSDFLDINYPNQPVSPLEDGRNLEQAVLMSKYPHIFFEELPKSKEYSSEEKPQIQPYRIQARTRNVQPKVNSNAFGNLPVNVQIPGVEDIVNAILPHSKSNFKVTVKISPKNISNDLHSGFKEIHTSVNKSYDKNGLRYFSTLNVSQISKIENLNDSADVKNESNTSRKFMPEIVMKNEETERDNQMKLLFEIHKKRIDEQLDNLQRERVYLENLLDNKKDFNPMPFLDVKDNIYRQDNYVTELTHKTEPITTTIKTTTTKTTTSTPLTTTHTITTSKPIQDREKELLIATIKHNNDTTNEILQKINENTNLLKIFLNKLSKRLENTEKTTEIDNNKSSKDTMDWKNFAPKNQLFRQFVFVLLLFEPHSIFTYTIAKPEVSNDTDVFEVKPLPDNGLQIIDKNPKKPSLFEIIYYHIIRKPFEQDQANNDIPKHLDFDQSVRPFTNGQGYQFVEWKPEEVHPIEPVEDIQKKTDDKKDESKKSVENDSDEKPASAEDAKKTDKYGEDKKDDKLDYDDEDQSAHDRKKREINDEDFAKFFGGSDENNDSAPKDSNHLPQNQISFNPEKGFKDRATDMFDEIPSVNGHKGKTYGMDLTGNHGTVWNDLSQTPVGIDSNQEPNSVLIDSNENKLNNDKGNQGNIWSGSNEVQPVSNEKIILTPVTDDGVEIPPAPKIVEQRPDEEEPADSDSSVIVEEPAVKSTEEENVPIHHTNVILQQPVIVVPPNLNNVIKNSNEDDSYTKPLVNNANSEEPLDDFKDRANAMFNKMPNDFANKEEKPKTYGMDLVGNKGVVWNDLDETPVGSDNVGVPSVNTIYYKPQESEENDKPSKNIIYEATRKPYKPTYIVKPHYTHERKPLKKYRERYHKPMYDGDKLRRSFANLNNQINNMQSKSKPVEALPGTYGMNLHNGKGYTWNDLNPPQDTVVNVGEGEHENKPAHEDNYVAPESTEATEPTSQSAEPNSSAESQSNEQPSSSNEQPSSSYEQPSSSNEQPDSSNEQPSSSNEQSSASNEQPSSSNEQQSSSNEQPSSSNEEPSSSNEQPSSSNERPSSSNEQPSSSNEEPSSSNYQTSSSNEQPSSSNEQPSSSNEEPSSSNEQPSSSNEQPSSLNEQPSSSNEEPSSSNEQPSSSNEQPSSSNEQPSSSNEESSSSNKQPSEAHKKPSPSHNHHKPSHPHKRPSHTNEATKKPATEKRKEEPSNKSKPKRNTEKNYKKDKNSPAEKSSEPKANKKANSNDKPKNKNTSSNSKPKQKRNKPAHKSPASSNEDKEKPSESNGPSNNNNTSVNVHAGTIYGNTVGKDHIQNVFNFYNGQGTNGNEGASNNKPANDNSNGDENKKADNSKKEKPSSEESHKKDNNSNEKMKPKSKSLPADDNSSDENSDENNKKPSKESKVPHKSESSPENERDDENNSSPDENSTESNEKPNKKSKPENKASADKKREPKEKKNDSVDKNSSNESSAGASKESKNKPETKPESKEKPRSEHKKDKAEKPESNTEPSSEESNKKDNDSNEKMKPKSKSLPTDDNSSDKNSDETSKKPSKESKAPHKSESSPENERDNDNNSSPHENSTESNEKPNRKSKPENKPSADKKREPKEKKNDSVDNNSSNESSAEASNESKKKPETKPESKEKPRSEHKKDKAEKPESNTEPSSEESNKKDNDSNEKIKPKSKSLPTDDNSSDKNSDETSKKPSKESKAPHKSESSPENERDDENNSSPDENSTESNEKPNKKSKPENKASADKKREPKEKKNDSVDNNSSNESSAGASKESNKKPEPKPESKEKPRSENKKDKAEKPESNIEPSKEKEPKSDKSEADKKKPNEKPNKKSKPENKASADKKREPKEKKNDSVDNNSSNESSAEASKESNKKPETKSDSKDKPRSENDKEPKSDKSEADKKKPEARKEEPKESSESKKAAEPKKSKPTEEKKPSKPEESKPSTEKKPSKSKELKPATEKKPSKPEKKPSKSKELKPATEKKPSKSKESKPENKPSKSKELKPATEKKPSKSKELKPATEKKPSKSKESKPENKPSKSKELKPATEKKPSKSKELKPATEKKPSKSEDEKKSP
ncbi:unnamed protein product [Colias eurytheme]|nr:unnamed protein product [Colias eurytheme]